MLKACRRFILPAKPRGEISELYNTILGSLQTTLQMQAGTSLVRRLPSYAKAVGNEAKLEPPCGLPTQTSNATVATCMSITKEDVCELEYLYRRCQVQHNS